MNWFDREYVLRRIQSKENTKMKRRLLVIPVLCLAYTLFIGQPRTYADATSGTTNAPNSLVIVNGCSDLAMQAFGWAIAQGYDFDNALWISSDVYDDCLAGRVSPN